MLKTIKNVPNRVVKAMGYSLSGLAQAYRKEESVRLELLALAILAVVLALVPWPAWKKLALVAVYLIVPLTELLNSAIEDVCDLVSPGINPFVKAAKDKGSAVVLVAIVLNVVALVALILCPNGVFP
ncbi:MAG: diacylglycerol kinase [Deltaproteobacteria bacterium]|jgi:diacylglycerol kinase (ATP)|nr:diacylglycerol kinase [Deltaproteobacteria bacterium]